MSPEPTPGFENRTHGIRTTYVRGCRCDDCRDSATRYQRERMEANRDIVFCKPEPWMNHAACQNHPIEWWFPNHSQHDDRVGNDHDTRHYYAQARVICDTCPVRAQCLNYALEHGERFGMWGGRTPRERRAA